MCHAGKDRFEGTAGILTDWLNGEMRKVSVNYKQQA